MIRAKKYENKMIDAVKEDKLKGNERKRESVCVRERETVIKHIYTGERVTKDSL